MCSRANVSNIKLTNSYYRRHQSPIIEIRVGQNGEIFNVHADILKRGEYFKKCLDGNFREGNEQVIDLPEEDPATFSFVIAWLYEGTFMPVKALSSVLGGHAFRIHLF